MAIPVIMPKFEMSQETATIVEWLRGEGDTVDKGEPVLVIETDKISMEVESPAAGILAGIRGEPSQVIAVTKVIAYILRPGEKLPDREIPAPQPALVESPAKLRSQATLATSVTQQLAGVGERSNWNAEGGLLLHPDFELAGKVRATPAARRVARERGIALTAVAGTGPQGRVQAADVAAWTPVSVESSAKAKMTPMSGIRRTIAQRMSASHLATARVTLITEADASNLHEARARLKASVEGAWGFAPSYNALLALIVARALQEFPYMNARLSEDGSSIERFRPVNLGLAVDTDSGLLVPVVRDAQQKGLRAIATEFRELVERARSGRLLPDDLSGGTFTITNLGMFDVDAFTPIINLPEAAILGAGRIRPKPVVHEGEIVVRQMWTLSLAFDHRLVDGAPAARFLQWIRKMVENPFLLLSYWSSMADL